jgi:thioesterase DpgC
MAASDLYAELTEEFTLPVRLEDLVERAAGRLPWQLPTREQLEVERDRPLAEKEGLELAQGEFVAELLADQRAGRHLLESMLRPSAEARARLDELHERGVVDFGPVRLTRQGKAGVLELHNPQHLNAEDGTTLGATEAAVDLILLDPEIEVGVIRGGVIETGRYAGGRVFGAGINLTHLYAGRIDFLFYLIRDLGYVNKIFRGIMHDDGTTTEKLWIAGVEQYAIGGACQLLHVVDHVIAERGARLYLPARREGIIPGASNLRLPRFVGDRAARQAILSGREWIAGEADAALICDEVIDPGEMDAALEARVESLTSSGLINASANRAALRSGQEPLDLFRDYMSTYAIEQAHCHLSPALVANLEQHWNARRR